MGIKEGTCDEHGVFFLSVESLNSTPDANITLYVNWNLNENLGEKRNVNEFGTCSDIHGVD